MIRRDIQYYQTAASKCAYLDWFQGLRDSKTKAIVAARLNRIALGNMGDCSPVGDGVFELRIHVGPGYRIYFGYVGSKVILLLCGGDKKTQSRDITKAQEYLTDYEERSNG